MGTEQEKVAIANHADDVRAIGELMRRARRLLFITGAGISADSGLPTYRGIGGLYHDRTTEENIPIEVALSGAMFLNKPHVTWKYLHQIESACRGARYNDAHHIIAGWQNDYDVCVLTQNIDGFHRAAGSRNLIEIHGDIHDLKCSHCEYTTSVADFSALSIPPSCPRCGAAVRPQVVLFGEALPIPAVYKLDRELERGFDLIFSIGTTSVFPYIAGPVVVASQLGIPTVEINPGDSRVSALVDYRLKAGASVGLRAIRDAVSN